MGSILWSSENYLCCITPQVPGTSTNNNKKRRNCNLLVVFTQNVRIGKRGCCASWQVQLYVKILLGRGARVTCAPSSTRVFRVRFVKLKVRGIPAHDYTTNRDGFIEQEGARFLFNNSRETCWTCARRHPHFHAQPHCIEWVVPKNSSLSSASATA